MARIRDVSSTSSTPFEENSHQTSFYGFSSVHGSNRDDAIGTRTTAPQQVRITDEPAFELPWSVRGISTDDVVQEGMTSPGGKRCEHSTKPASSSERLDLMAVQYQSRSTTWLAVHDHHSRVSFTTSPCAFCVHTLYTVCVVYSDITLTGKHKSAGGSCFTLIGLINAA